MLQRLIALKKYVKAFAVDVSSHLLKEYNASVMFVLFPIRDARFLPGSTQLDPTAFIPTFRKGEVVYLDTTGPWSTRNVRGNTHSDGRNNITSSFQYQVRTETTTSSST